MVVIRLRISSPRRRQDRPKFIQVEDELLHISSHETSHSKYCKQPPLKNQTARAMEDADGIK